MSYKYSNGPTKQDDIYAKKSVDADGNTYINFEEDYIGLVAGGVTLLEASGSVVSSSVNISASAFYGDGSNLTGISGGGGSTSPAGSDGQIQYNNSDSFGAGANLYWDDTNDRAGVGTSSPLSMLDVNGALAVATTYVAHASGTGTFTYNVDDTHFHLDCQASNGDLHIQLPTLASSTGRIYSVKKIHGSYSIYIKAQSGEYIDDTVPGSVHIPTNGMCVIIISSQGRWRTLAKLQQNA